jgi:hypothetical protein
MPPKGGNAKKEAGRAKKAENEEKKKSAASATKVWFTSPITSPSRSTLLSVIYTNTEIRLRQEKVETDKWADGAKDNSKAKQAEEKRKAEAARKAENARLLAEEEKDVPKVAKAAPKNAKKTAPKPAGPGAIAAGGGIAG